MLRVELREVDVSCTVSLLSRLLEVDSQLTVMFKSFNLRLMQGNFSIVHSLEHAKLGHHLPRQVSLLGGVCGAERVQHRPVWVLELLLGGRLLALAASYPSSCRVGLLRLSLLVEQLGLEEVGIGAHKMIWEACGAMLHPILLVGLLLVLLRHLELHLGRLLLVLLL